MTDPFRVLCAELLDALQGYVEYAPVIDEGVKDEQRLVVKARAALSQPEPVAPTNDELTLVYAYAVAAAVGNKRGPFEREEAEAAQLAGLRAVLARWGQP